MALYDLLEIYIEHAGSDAATALIEEAIRDLVPDELIPLDQVDPRGRLRGLSA